MTQEIVDAVRDIEREKGIEGGTLVAALEDALLAAYKKTPEASRHATVEIDEQGDFRVYSIELPPDIEERLLDEARERALEELERISVRRHRPSASHAQVRDVESAECDEDRAVGHGVERGRRLGRRQPGGGTGRGGGGWGRRRRGGGRWR